MAQGLLTADRRRSCSTRRAFRRPRQGRSHSGRVRGDVPGRPRGLFRKKEIHHDKTRHEKSQAYEQGRQGRAVPCGLVAQGSESERYAGQSQQGHADTQHDKSDRKQGVHVFWSFLFGVCVTATRRRPIRRRVALSAGKRLPAPFFKNNTTLLAQVQYKRRGNALP